MPLPSLADLGLDVKPVVDVNAFSEEKECDYKGEHYSVRDNGAVMRHAKAEERPRKLDNVWTFGRKDVSVGGYMYVGSHRVHIICATAFFGSHDSKKFVVDHIDTNRCNNRKENLRWLTRLENALNNPITRKRIERLCGGDIQKFIDNPSCLRTDERSKDLEWMRTVTAEEAKNAKENLERWASKPIFTPYPNLPKVNMPCDKEWMYKKPKQIIDDGLTPEERATQTREWHRNLVIKQYNKDSEDRERETMIEYVQAISPEVAGQVGWATPSEFPYCPETITDDVLYRYADALKPNCVFAKNMSYESKVSKVILIDNGKRLAVATYPTQGLKCAVAVVYVHEGKILHETYGTYFSSGGVEKALTELQGLEWTGGDVMDDFC